MIESEDMAGTGLKAKEKVLVQLGEYRTDPDDIPLPFEITQKGLSDHLGLRRSHIAMALQDLVKEGLVTVHKGHIEGGQRRQNAYLLTEAGVRRARETRDRLAERAVRYEGKDGVDTRSIGDIIESRKISLPSIIYQLDRGGTVRDEITIVAQASKRLIPVFCPTCQKQIEVENTFEDEEVGFDCPGCGRPYRIVPVLETQSRRRRTYPTWAILWVIASMVGCYVYFITFAEYLCMDVLVVGIVVIISLVILLTSSPGVKKKKPTPMAGPQTMVLFAAFLGAVLLVSWHLFVSEIDLREEIILFGPLVAGITFGYYGIASSASHLRGEFLLAVGLLLVMVAVTTMFTEHFGEFGVSTAPFLGISGGVLLGLTQFQSIEGNEMKLAAAFASGSYLLVLTPVVILGECESTGDFIAAGTLIAVGLFLTSLRMAQVRVTDHDLGEMLAAATPLAGAFGLVMMGIILIMANAVVAGVFELVAMLPFGYLGARRVFDENWMYKLPVVSFLAGATLLVTVLALHT